MSSSSRSSGGRSFTRIFHDFVWDPERYRAEYDHRRTIMMHEIPAAQVQLVDEARVVSHFRRQRGDAVGYVKARLIECREFGYTAAESRPIVRSEVLGFEGESWRALAKSAAKDEGCEMWEEWYVGKIWTLRTQTLYSLTGTFFRTFHTLYSSIVIVFGVFRKVLSFIVPVQWLANLLSLLLFSSVILSVTLGLYGTMYTSSVLNSQPPHYALPLEVSKAPFLSCRSVFDHSRLAIAKAQSRIEASFVLGDIDINERYGTLAQEHNELALATMSIEEKVTSIRLDSEKELVELEHWLHRHLLSLVPTWSYKAITVNTALAIVCLAPAIDDALGPAIENNNGLDPLSLALIPFPLLFSGTAILLHTHIGFNVWEMHKLVGFYARRSGPQQHDLTAEAQQMESTLDALLMHTTDGLRQVKSVEDATTIPQIAVINRMRDQYTIDVARLSFRIQLFDRLERQPPPSVRGLLSHLLPWLDSSTAGGGGGGGLTPQQDRERAALRGKLAVLKDVLVEHGTIYLIFWCAKEMVTRVNGEIERLVLAAGSAGTWDDVGAWNTSTRTVEVEGEGESNASSQMQRSSSSLSNSSSWSEYRHRKRLDALMARVQRFRAYLQQLQGVGLVPVEANDTIINICQEHVAALEMGRLMEIERGKVEGQRTSRDNGL